MGSDTIIPIILLKADIRHLAISHMPLTLLEAA
jgi:hypothetical protein